MKHSVLNPSGFFETTGFAGELTRGETMMCCHCSRLWIVEPRSGKRRGFCPGCVAYTCGAEACAPCIPYEVRLENLEAGRPELTPRPVQIVVPGLSGT